MPRTPKNGAPKTPKKSPAKKKQTVAKKPTKKKTKVS